jgi:polyisoprenyl-teichoic acid--peptidoglycan teichoic acid transferase
MEYKENFQRSLKSPIGKEKKKKKWLKPLSIVVVIIIVIGGLVSWRAGSFLNKISSNSNILGSLGRMIPGVNNELKGEKENRINILLLGMRGENVPGGGTLADTIMVASINPAENKVGILSIPRDFYVDNPALNAKSKINAVYAYGEQQGDGKGMKNMEKVIGDIVGEPINYSLVINFKGFTDLVNALGGVDVELTKPFEESMQFNEEKVCDPSVFTKPTGNFEIKKRKKADGTYRITAKYPLCTNPDTECGGDFTLPAGKQTLTGEQALCFTRSRKTTSDFERAKRQQMIIQKIKDKALAIGTLTDFNKVNDVLNSLGNDVKTDLQAWEMKRFFELQQKMQNPQISQFVLENSEQGLLYNPPETPEAGYILLPLGDNYDNIRNLFKNIFTTPSQSDAKPNV